MPPLHRCSALIFLILRKIDAPTTEGIIPRLSYEPYRCRLTMLTIESGNEKLVQPLVSLEGYLLDADYAMKTKDAKAESKNVKKALASVKRALTLYDELGKEEPKMLIELFNTLVKHRNELEPDQSQGRSR